ncbi:NUDIX hydrolase [Larkinella soli]|uniref:NUDIX hydrolase n=1 Tax=Larkinella soli TaxID=1770527 RepID=UPI00286E26A8|nr:NUDIX domain-containing protein [Larkinella soli]
MMEPSEPRDTLLIELVENGDRFLPHLSIDCVVFGFHASQLKVLLLKLTNADLYALPGGYIYQEEDTDQAGARILAERTGLTRIYLEQFGVFGRHDRTNNRVHQQIFESFGIPFDPDFWMWKRFVSIGYYALVDYDQVTPTPDLFSDRCDWHDVGTLPPLLFDHARLVEKALETLRLMLDHKLVGFNLLPEMFTMAELQGVYETILNRKFQRTNFQRKMLSLGILERVQKKYGGGSHKAPYLYRFDTGKA